MTVPRVSMTDYRALARFRHALRVFERFSEQASRDVGITPAQHQLILAIKGWPHEQPPTVSDLAEMLQLKHHSTVELIQRADRAGLVASFTASDDARRQLNELTTHGEEVLRSLSVLHRDELRRFRNEMLDVLDELD